jgi:hypothetical protein
MTTNNKRPRVAAVDPVALRAALIKSGALKPSATIAQYTHDEHGRPYRTRALEDAAEYDDGDDDR